MIGVAETDHVSTIHHPSTLTHVPEPLFLSVWDAEGQKHTLGLPGPGGKVRVCIGDSTEGPHSSIWTVWAGRNRGDVYIAVRSIAGWQKFSLHETGDWRHQWVDTDRVREAVNRPTRIIDQWRPPAEDPTTLMTQGFSIRCRHKDLADYGERGRFPKEVVWIPAQQHGDTTVVHVAIVRIHDEPVTFGGLVPFHAFALADGRAVFLLAITQDLSADVNAKIDALIAQVRAEISENDKIDLAAAEGPRMALYGHDSTSGSRFAWDIALRPGAGEPRE